MKSTLRLLTVMLLGYAGIAYGAGPEPMELSPAMVVFLSFCALFLVGQLLPGATLFWSMLKGLFAPGAAAAGKPR